MENKITIDERDLYSYLDIELYIKEREYLVTQKEALLLKNKANLLKAKKIMLNKGDHDHFPKELVEGILVMVFLDDYGRQFHCWTNVALQNPNQVRFRKMHLNVEDIKVPESFNQFVIERNHLLNCAENNEVAVLLRDKHLPIKIIRFENDRLKDNSWAFLKNQVAGTTHFIFENNYYVWTHNMYFQEKTRVRKKEV